MGYVERLWLPDSTAFGLSAADRKPGTYRAFVPDPLMMELPSVSRAAEDAADDALAAVIRVDEQVGNRTAFLRHLLIRSESISSSWIEGNRVTPKRLAIAERLGMGPDVAKTVIANVRATEEAIDSLSDAQQPVTVADIVALQHVIAPQLEPGLRTAQNWVGGPGFSPLRAEFVPPPESFVPDLMKNLAEYVSRTDGNPIIRAALAHAQFETIHPFIDGNGRTGRALIHTILKRSGAVRHSLLPISTVFAGNKDDYIRGLTSFRDGVDGVTQWIIGFAEAAKLAARNASTLAAKAETLRDEHLERLIAYRAEMELVPTVPRSDSATIRALNILSSDPILTVEGLGKRIGASSSASSRALSELCAAGVLSRVKNHKGRVVAWSADDFFHLTTNTERANRVGDTSTRNRRPKYAPSPAVSSPVTHPSPDSSLN